MTWLASAKYALHLALSALTRRGHDLPAHGKAPHGPATITAPQSKANGAHTLPDLRLRAHRLHNRNRQAAERYLRLHQTLAKEALNYD